MQSENTICDLLGQNWVLANNLRHQEAKATRIIFIGKTVCLFRGPFILDMANSALRCFKVKFWTYLRSELAGIDGHGNCGGGVYRSRPVIFK